MTSVSCAELRDAYLRGERPSGEAVERHLAECDVCAALSAPPTLGPWLALPLTSEARLDAALEAKVASALGRERGGRAWLRSRSTRVRIALVLGVGALVVAVQLLAKAPADLGPSLWISAFALGVSVALLVATARPSPHWQKLSLFLVAADLPLLLATFFEYGNAGQDAGDPLRCFAFGAALSLPFLAAVFAVERRERIPPFDWALIGAALGLFATVVLELHCANTHPGHLMFGHVSVGWTFIALLGGFAFLRGRRAGA